MVRLPPSNVTDAALTSLRTRWDAGQRDLRDAVRLAMAYVQRRDAVNFARVARAAIEQLHETPPRERDVTAVAFLLMGLSRHRLTVTWREGVVGTKLIVNMSAVEMSWLDGDADYERLAALLCGDAFVNASLGHIAEPDPGGRLAGAIWGSAPARAPGSNRAQRRARSKRSRRRR